MHSFVIGCLVDAKWQQFALPCYAKLIGLLLNTKIKGQKMRFKVGQGVAGSWHSVSLSSPNSEPWAAKRRLCGSLAKP